MATLEQRIKLLEQKKIKPQKSKYEMTDQELLDIAGLPHDATREQVMAVAKGETPLGVKLASCRPEAADC